LPTIKPEKNTRSFSASRRLWLCQPMRGALTAIQQNSDVAQAAPVGSFNRFLRQDEFGTLAPVSSQVAGCGIAFIRRAKLL